MSLNWFYYNNEKKKMAIILDKENLYKLQDFKEIISLYNIINFKGRFDDVMDGIYDYRFGDNS
jgi:hypothetical protein